RTTMAVAEGFLTKLNATASVLLYSSFVGGGDYDIAYAVAADSSGHAYVTGYTQSLDMSMSGDAMQGVSGGQADAYVAAIDTNASGAASMLYCTYLGGSGVDHGNAIAAFAGVGVTNVYVAGDTTSRNFPTA